MTQSRIELIEHLVKKRSFRMEETNLGYEDVPYVEKSLRGFNFAITQIISFSLDLVSQLKVLRKI